MSSAVIFDVARKVERRGGGGEGGGGEGEGGGGGGREGCAAAGVQRQLWVSKYCNTK